MVCEKDNPVVPILSEEIHLRHLQIRHHQRLACLSQSNRKPSSSSCMSSICVINLHASRSQPLTEIDIVKHVVEETMNSPGHPASIPVSSRLPNLAHQGRVYLLQLLHATTTCFGHEDLKQIGRVNGIKNKLRVHGSKSSGWIRSGVVQERIDVGFLPWPLRNGGSLRRAFGW